MSSIWQSGCALAKQIKEFDIVDDVRRLYSSFSASGEGKIQNKILYKQYADNNAKQAYGYLKAIKNRENINEQIGLHGLKLPELSPKEIILIKQVHFFINEFDRKLINRHFGTNIELKDTLKSYENILSNDDKIDKYFDSVIFEDLLSAFDDSLSIKNINELESSFPNLFCSKKIKPAVHKILSDINRQKPWECSDDLVMAAMRSQLNTDEGKITKGLFSIAVLCEQINSINQLIFQAFLNDNLVCFGEDEIFDIKHDRSNTVGRGMKIFVQSNISLFIDCGDIILTTVPGSPSLIKAIVKGITIKHSKESGAFQNMALRLLDDDMNPFENLIKK